MNPKTITVGRATIGAPNNDGRNAETVALSGVSSYATEIEAESARRNLTAHAGAFVPVLADDYDSTLTGWYSLESARCVDRKGLIGFVYSVTLAKIAGGYNAAVFEDSFSPATQDGSPSSTAGDYFAAWPVDAGWVNKRPIEVAFSDIPCQFSDISIVDPSNAANPVPTRYQLDPDQAYYAAVTLEVKESDGSWYPMVGRNLTSQHTMSNVRISNGLLRVSFTFSALEDACTMSMERWTGSDWGAVETYTIESASQYEGFFTNIPPTVLRNDISSVQIVFHATRPDSTSTYEYLNGPLIVRLDRGWRMAQFSAALSSGIYQWYLNSGEATTTFGGSWPDVYVQDGTDADGNKSVWSRPDTASTPTLGRVETPVGVGIMLSTETADDLARTSGYIASSGVIRIVT